SGPLWEVVGGGPCSGCVPRKALECGSTRSSSKRRQRREVRARGAGHPTNSRRGPLVLLTFDTATPLVTVALHDGEDVVCELVSERPMKHGEQLAPLIDQ